MNRELFDRLRAVENEYLSCRAALAFAAREWAAVSAAPEWQGRLRSQTMEALARLEDTYIIRIFSEFEAILRDYWAATQVTAVPTRVETLINRLGARYRVTAPTREGAHEVQYYRNALVHRAERRARTVSFGDARRALNLFLAELPDV